MEFTQSADSTVSSFVNLSAQHRGMRPNLIAMKNKILKAKITRLVVPCQSAQTGKPVSNAQCNSEGTTPSCKRVLNQTKGSEILNLQTSGQN